VVRDARINTTNARTIKKTPSRIVCRVINVLPWTKK